MNTHPILAFFVWLAELSLTILFTSHLNFDWADFRVWSAWGVALFLGFVQWIVNRKKFKPAFSEWVKEIKNMFRPIIK